jgi:hypothetical protein
MNSLFERSEIHRYLSRQLLYPILLSTLLAVALMQFGYFTAVVCLRQPGVELVFGLAAYVFALIAGFVNFMLPGSWWLLLVPGLWLLFFPNAPICSPTFFILEDRPNIPLWYDILLLSSSSLDRLFPGSRLLRTMQIMIKEYLGYFAAGSSLQQRWLLRSGYIPGTFFTLE